MPNFGDILIQKLKNFLTKYHTIATATKNFKAARRNGRFRFSYGLDY